MDNYNIHTNPYSPHALYFIEYTPVERICGDSLKVFSQDDLDRIFFTPYVVLYPHEDRYIAFNNPLTNHSVICEFHPECMEDIIHRYLDGASFEYQEFIGMLTGSDDIVQKTVNILFKESMIE